MPVRDAAVVAINTSNGQRWETTTGERGRYFLENVSVGGPYLIEARALGFRPRRTGGITLNLGQRYTADFVLVEAPIRLAEVTVTASVDPVINAGRTGPAQIISDSALTRLPLLGRNFLDLVLESPQATRTTVGGSLIGGQNNRANNIQVDGGVNNDLFGREEIPAGTHPVSIEALKQVQVLVAPFDVRQGSFTGGVINAVTESGTNQFHGSAFGYLQDERLVGKDAEGNRLAEFTTGQFGATLGGPIVRDRLHFFLATDIQRNVVPYDGPLIGSDTTGGADSAGVGVRYASALRFQEILQNTYAVNPGNFLDPVNGRNPTSSVFGKLTTQLGANSRVELSQSFVRGSLRGFFVPRGQGFYGLSSQDEDERGTSSATRLNWNAVLGGKFSNELVLGYLRIRGRCRPSADFPLILVAADSGTLQAGAGEFCPTRRTDQDAIELTDNLTFGLHSHRVTLGTHSELLHFLNTFFFGSSGVWAFGSLDSLEQGLPGFYTRNVPGPLRPEGPRADFRVRQLGFYVQDQWSPAPRLTLTAGLRFDVPYFPDRPSHNPAVEQELGVDTREYPSGNLLWSPRVGFNYDVAGTASTSLRGGIGLFTGRPPYNLPANAYRNTGLEQLRVICFDEDSPAFTIDPAAQPTACRSGGAEPVPTVSFFEKGFKFPQTLKLALGVDRRLPGGIVGTFDFLYTRSVNQIYFTDANLLPPSGAVGEGGRALYGVIDTETGEATPSRRSPAFGPVVRQLNRSGDRSYSLSGQLQRQFGTGLSFNAGYTYSNTRDRVSNLVKVVIFTLAGTPLDGTLEDRRLSTSFFDVPHKLRLSGTVTLSHRVYFSLIYQGLSGAPYTYVVDGDVNGDGFGGPFGVEPNDVVYVPRDAGDISLEDPGAFPELDEFIRNEKCLQRQRGRIMARNSCRNPWRTTLDARLSTTIPSLDGHSLEITADLFNLLNFLDGDWGRYRFTAFDQWLPLLSLAGFDAANGRGLYQLNLPERRIVDMDGSRWRMQLGARYAF